MAIEFSIVEFSKRDSGKEPYQVVCRTRKKLANVIVQNALGSIRTK